jgi:hypothetical protein
MMRRPIALLMLAATLVPAGSVRAQDTISAPSPGQAAAPPPGGPNSLATFAGPPELPPSVLPNSNTCSKDFAPLREDAERRGKLIREAGERQAPPEETCRLIGTYSRSERRMIGFVEANSVKCKIPPQVADQLKDGNKKTAALLARVCAAVPRRASHGYFGAISDFGDPAFARGH